MTTIKRHGKWYRHPEPWLLLLAPAVAVVAGFFTWWLAANTNNSLVVDDYYREGRAINQAHARDARSVALALNAQWSVDVERNIASLRLRAGSPGFAAGERLAIRLVHATEAQLDHRFEMKRVEPERWEAPFAAPIKGRWTLHIEDQSRAWRLMARLEDPRATLMIQAFPHPVVSTGAVDPTAERAP